MKTLSDGSFITIQSWMVSTLGLKGLDLLIYAIIYGFSQDGKSTFNGTISYLMQWTNSSYKGVQKSLNSLINRGLIRKDVFYKDSVRMVSYFVNFSVICLYQKGF